MDSATSKKVLSIAVSAAFATVALWLHGDIPTTFDSETWINTSFWDLRYPMLGDLCKGQRLIGKTKHEIYQLLGRPECGLSTDDWITYEV